MSGDEASVDAAFQPHWPASSLAARPSSRCLRSTTASSSSTRWIASARIEQEEIMSEQLPNLDLTLFDLPPGNPDQRTQTTHPAAVRIDPRTLFSRLLVEEAARLLEHFGAETHLRPVGPAAAGRCPVEHPKVQELRELVQWSEGQVWCSPERHGAMSAVFKAQIDWTAGAGRRAPHQGKTLAVMQVCGGSQSFNVVNQLRVLGRWMRMFTIPNQSRYPRLIWSSTRPGG
jgi:arsenic resistance protein ArsH